MMKSLRKAIIAVLCAATLVVGSVAGTMAYLTDNDSVTNTFTVGNVAITLDEAKVNPDGTEVTGDEAGRVTANEYKLIPGHEYKKDPIVHVSADSEDCWLFVKVENEISAIEDSTSSIASQMANKGWTLVNGTENVYAYSTVVSKNANVSVFETFKVDGEKDITDYEGVTIKVTAYAIQADGFDSAEAAWAAAGSSFPTTTESAGE